MQDARTWITLRRLLAMAAVLLLMGIVCAAGREVGSAAADPTVAALRTVGSTSLSELGYLSTDVVRFPDKRAFSFDFPKDAAQGPRIWYVLHLHFEVELAPDTDGVALVSAATNDRTVAQVEVEAHPGQPLAYSATGLLTGKTRTVVDSRTADVRFSNYLQEKGVQPGSTQFSVSIESLGGARVQRLTVFDDSSIEATADSPFALSLTPASAVTPTPVAGKRFNVRYALGVQKGRHVGDVAVAASASDGLQIVGPAMEDLGQLRDGYDGRFSFVAPKAGEYEIRLRAKSDINQPAATVRVRVVDHVSSGVSPVLVGAIGAGLVAIALVDGPGRRLVRRKRTGGSRAGTEWSRISARVLIVGGVAMLALAVALLVLPIRASSTDSPHDCGSLLARHPSVLRRQFCDEKHSYRSRELWVLMSGLVGSASLIAAATREGRGRDGGPPSPLGAGEP